MTSTNTMFIGTTIPQYHDHYIKFKLGISCFSYVLYIGKILFILGIYLLHRQITYFLALGTIPVTGVGFIARKITLKTVQSTNLYTVNLFSAALSEKYFLYFSIYFISILPVFQTIKTNVFLIYCKY